MLRFLLLHLVHLFHHIALSTATNTSTGVLITAPSSVTVPIPSGASFGLQPPKPVLLSIPFSLLITLAPLNCQSSSSSSSACQPWPESVPFRLITSTANFSGSLANVSSSAGLGVGLSFIVKGITVSDLGTSRLSFAVLTNSFELVTPAGVTDTDTGIITTGSTTTGITTTTTTGITTVMTTVIFVIPPILSVFPPVVTLVLAVYTKQVLPSLLAGVWTGALLTSNYNPLVAFCKSFSTYFVGAIVNNGHGPVILFALVLGGVLELVDKSGGAQGLAEKARGFASTRMRALLCAWILSVLVFFDDYSAILIVGSMLKDSLRKVRVSPAKLAFIIHMVGVNLPSIMPVSSWVGVELGYIADSYDALHLNQDRSPFSVFLRTIPYRFFPLLAIIYPLLAILLRREFGSLLKAERKFLSSLKDVAGDRGGEGGARGGGGGKETERNMLNVNFLSSDDRKDGGSGSGSGSGGGDIDSSTSTFPVVRYDSLDSAPPIQGWWPNAVIPFSIIVLVTFAGIFVSGLEKAPGPHPSLVDIVANADSVDALLWSAAAASAVSMLMYGTCQRIMTLEKLVSAWTTGFKEMMEPLLILLLAWALGAVVNELQTSVFLSSMLGGSLNVVWLPVIATLMAGLVSFASGSAMGTMGILFPLVLPLAHSLGSETYVMQAAGAVFAGSTFGNTASPIADNTVLSSIATNCDLVVHAQTMLPSSVLIFLVSIVFGTMPVSLGWYSPLVGMLLSICVLAGVLMLLGENVETGERGIHCGRCCREEEEE